MEIEIELTRTHRDLLAFNLFYERQPHVSRKNYWRGLFVHCVCLTGIIAYLFRNWLRMYLTLFKQTGQSGWLRPILMGLVISLVVAFLVHHLFERAAQWWRLRSHFWPAFTNQQAWRHKITINENSITNVAYLSGSAESHEWATVVALNETRHHYFVYTAENAALIIPKRCFASAEEQLNFVQPALLYWQKAQVAQQKTGLGLRVENHTWLWCKRLADGALVLGGFCFLVGAQFWGGEIGQRLYPLLQPSFASVKPPQTAAAQAKYASFKKELAQRLCEAPENDELRLELAEQFREEGRDQKARDLYYEYYLKNPRANEALHELGDLAFEQEHFAEAESWWRASLAVEPKAAWTRMRLADSLREQHQPDKNHEARALYHEVLAQQVTPSFGRTAQAGLFALRSIEQTGWMADAHQIPLKHLSSQERLRLIEGLPLPALPAVATNRINGMFLHDSALALPADSRREIADWLRRYAQLDRGRVYLEIIETLPPNMTASAYVQARLNEWGRPKYDDRVLLLVVLEQQTLWLHTSDTTRAVISDEEARRICQSVMLPYFQRRAYVPGLKAGLQRITEKLQVGMRPAWQRKWDRKWETTKTLCAYGLAFWLVSLLLIIGHEASHSLVAQLAGLRVYRVAIGSGQTLCEFPLGKIKIEFNRRWAGGGTSLGTPRGYASRLGIWLMVAAGPGFHLFILTLLHLAYAKTNLSETLQAHTYLNIIFNVIYWRNWLDLAINLWPFTYRINTIEYKTDGYQLWRIPFYTQKDFDDYRQSALVLEWLEPFKANHIKQALTLIRQGRDEFPEAAVFTLAEAATLLHLGKYDEARALTNAALQGEGIKKHEAFLHWAYNDLAYAAALLNRPELFEEANEYSLKALKNPIEPGAAMGTRGSVLLRLQKVSEGMEMLTASIAQATSPRDRAENTCWLAIGYAMQNDFTQAQQSLAQARQSKIVPYFLAQAEAEVAALQQRTVQRPMTWQPVALAA